MTQYSAWMMKILGIDKGYFHLWSYGVKWTYMRKCCGCGRGDRVTSLPMGMTYAPMDTEFIVHPLNGTRGLYDPPDLHRVQKILVNPQTPTMHY